MISVPVAIRFTFAPLNYWFAGLSALAVPASALLLARSMPVGSNRSLALTLAAVMAVPQVPYGLLALSESTRMEGGTDPSYRLLSEVGRSMGSYRLYQTNCGATCSYGLELRREFSLLGLVSAVRPVWQAAPEDAATLRAATDGSIQVVRGEYVLHSEEE
jgi:hypothetical protein